MRLVNETFEQAFSLFTTYFNLDEGDIRLIFYNDIVLRKIAEKFIYTLPNKSNINLSGYFDKYFDTESLEWYVILHPELDNYDDIYSKLKMYIAMIMKQLNVYIDLNRREIFDYFKFNNEYKLYVKLKLSSLIESILNNLKEHTRPSSNFEVEKTNIIANVHTYRHNNKTVLLNNNAKKHLFQINVIEDKDKIAYKQSINVVVSIKNNYFNKKREYKEVKQITSIPIQLFSVIFGNKNEFIKKMIVSKNNVRKYSYIFSLEDIFVFEGISFKYICNILESYAYSKEPWMNLNWKNIYGRLMFFYLIDLFVNVRSNRIRNSIVTLSLNYIKLLQDINKEFSKGDEKETNRIYNKLIKIYKNKLDIYLLKLI